MKPTPKLYLFAAFMLLAAYILIGCTGSRFGSPCPSTGKQKMIGYGSYYRYSPLRDRWVFVPFNNCPPCNIITTAGPIISLESNLQWGGNIFTKLYYDSISKMPPIENQVDTLATIRPKYILIGTKSQ